MAESDAFMATVLEAAAAGYPWFVLHTANPGTTGAAPYPGMAREQATYGATTPPTKAAGVIALTVPAAGTATHWSCWSAESGGSMGQSGPLPVPVTFDLPGTYNLTPTLNFPVTP